MKKNKHRHFLYTVLIWTSRTIIILLLLSAAVVSVVFLNYLRELPQPEDFAESQFNQPTKIYDQTGQILLYNIVGEENRTVIPLEKISLYLQQAVISAEDGQFYQHHGLNFRGLARAILTDLRLQSPSQGGSTITQQLIRSYFLNNQKTVKRKTEEIILSLELERKYSKEQILEWYLNQVPFGSNFYGAETASQGYFNKPASDLSLVEATTLAALIKAPSYLSPYGQHLDQLTDRRTYVLQRMTLLGYISQDQMTEAQEQKPEFSSLAHLLRAPHFTLHVVQELKTTYGLNLLQRSGFKVYTTLNWSLQEKAETIIENGVAKDKIYKVYNGSLVAIDPRTGEVLSLVGSKDYFADDSYPSGCSVENNECLFNPQFDIARLGERHPGSSLKPFVYATAFEKGISPSHIIIDEQTNFGNWGGKDYVPGNYDGRFRGPVTLKQSLAQSLNVPSVKVFLYLAGIKDSIQTLESAGISSSLPAVPSLVLGGGGVKLLDLTSAYGIFATGGYKVEPFDILKIEDSQGDIIFQAQSQEEKRQVVSEATAQTITDILSSEKDRAPMFGYHSNLYVPGYKVAAKTGTNDDFRDSWVIGYTSKIIVGVWLGNNNQAPMAKVPAVTTAGWIWNQFMQQALPIIP
jgi:membrane peptidoglycan carboxypeptidase